MPSRGTSHSGAKRRGASAPSPRSERPPRPFEPGRAEPPLPIVDDLELSVAPPLVGKAHPPAEMDDATPSLDDEVSLYHQPGDARTSGFGYYPDAADAAADLAGDLGATFLSGATRGEDESDIISSLEDRDEGYASVALGEENLPKPARARARNRKSQRAPAPPARPTGVPKKHAARGRAR